MKNHTSIQGFNSLLKGKKSSTLSTGALRLLTQVDRASLHSRRQVKSPAQLWGGWTWW